MGLLDLFKKRIVSFERIVEHARCSLMVVEKLRQAVTSNIEDRLADCMKEIGEVENLEGEADTLRRGINTELTKGVLPPFSRQDLMRLVRRIDMVADYAHEASRLLTYLNLSKLNENLKRKILMLINETVYCAKLTLEATKTMSSDFKSVGEICDKIENSERKCDRLYLETLGQVIVGRCCDEGVMIALFAFLKALEEVSDMCEDASDVMRIISIRALE